MTALRFKRRTALRGLLHGAAVTVGLPALEAMFNSNGTAHADGSALPRRLGIFFFGNGVRLKFWTPAEIGPGWKLTPSLQPLQEVRDYINVVSGMNVMTGNGQGHHSGTVGILSGAPYSPPRFNGRSTFSAPSIDQVAAAALGKMSRFKSLEVGVCHGVKFVEGTTLGYLSHNGPDSPNPPEYAPKAFFTRLFGGATAMPAPTATPDKTALLRKSVLDAVQVDINNLRGRVSTFDRARLDQHTDNIRRLEMRLTSNPASSCGSAKDPGMISGPVSHEPMEEVTTAMSQLLAMALSCDQTRVFSMMFSGSVGQHIFWPAGLTSGHHNLTHDEGGDQPLIQASTVFTIKMFNVLVKALKDTPDGAGNLLDSSAVLCSSDTAEGRPHSLTDYPILVAGKGGGFFKYPGIHYRSAAENTSTVLLSLLRSVGLPLTTFGLGGGMVDKGCAAIEA